MKKITLSITFFIILSASAYAETSLWKVQNNAFTTYLGGTIHILRTSDYPLPKEFQKAYADSDTVIFETDLEKFNSAESQQKLLGKVMYTGGLNLQKVLSPEVYDRLKNYCDEAGVPIASMNQFKPSIVVLSLVVLELKKMGIDQRGIDLYFHQQATVDGKKTAGLETVDQQIEYISSMGEGNEDDFILHSLKDLNKTRQIFNQLIDGWKKGNEKEMSELLVEQFKTDYPALYSTLIVERNHAWLPKIEAYLRTPQKEFVLIGTGHLIGEDGIVHDLKKRGYRVEKFHIEE